MRLRCASSHAVATLAASLWPCRSGWHRRTSRRSISGGMPSGLARWPSSSSASTRRRRRADSARTVVEIFPPRNAKAQAGGFGAGLGKLCGQLRQPVGCGLPCGWARLPARQAKALPAFARGAGEGVPAFLAGRVRQGVGVGHRRASGAKGTRKGQTRDKTGTQGTQTEGTDRTTPLKGLSLSSRVFAVVPLPR